MAKEKLHHVQRFDQKGQRKRQHEPKPLGREDQHGNGDDGRDDEKDPVFG
jgi:hypothetical protein